MYWEQNGQYGEIQGKGDAFTGMKRYGTRRSYSSQASPYLVRHRRISLQARWVIIMAKKQGYIHGKGELKPVIRAQEVAKNKSQL